MGISLKENPSAEKYFTAAADFRNASLPAGTSQSYMTARNAVRKYWLRRPPKSKELF
jgi:hypothetical protein